MAERKRMDIEAVLGWAYRQELPKAAPSGSGSDGAAFAAGWSKVAELGELGALIETSNAYGCVPAFEAEGDPHPDALAVHRAVLALADKQLDAPEGYDVLGDMALADGSALSAAERADAHERGLAIARLEGDRLPAIVQRFAVLDRAPLLPEAERPERKPVLKNGQPAWFRRAPHPSGDGMIEIDGYDHRGQRPYREAYRKTRLRPDLAPIVEERAEYQAWVLVLAALVADLDGALSTIHPVGPNRALWPWEGEVAQAEPRVLESVKGRRRASAAARVA